MRNSQLEEQSSAVPSLRADLDATAKRVELLLVLLGEKEEELEAVLGDMKEVKHMYRSHMEELIEKRSPPLASATNTQQVTSFVSSSSAAASIASAATAEAKAPSE